MAKKPAITLTGEAFDLIVLDLRDIAKRADSHAYSGPDTIADACTIVANLICCAPHGSSVQADLMERAAAAGFSAGYYPGGIRVYWEPKEVSA